MSFVFKLGKIKNFLVYLFLFLLPWQTRLILRPGELAGGYWEYGTISIYATETLLWTALFLHIVTTLKKSGIRNQESVVAERDPVKAVRIRNDGPHTAKKFLIHNSLFIILVLVIYYFLFLGLFAPKPGIHLYYGLRFAESIGLYFLIKSADRRKAAWAFIFGMIPQAFLGIWQFLAQTSFANKWLGMAAHDPSALGTFVVETASGRWLRAYGGLPHPNILGAYLVLGLLLLLSFFGSDSNQGIKNYELRIKHKVLKLKSIIYNSLFIIFASALFFTFSRSAWLALAGIIIIIIFRSAEHRRKLLILNSLLLILVFLVLGIIFREPLLSRVQNQSRLEIKSQIERLSGVQESWKIFKAHPLIGVGLGNYTYAFWKEIDGSRPSYVYQPVHNIFLLFLVETGIVSFLLLTALFLHLAANKFLILHPELCQRVNSCLPRTPLMKSMMVRGFLILTLGFFDHYLLTLYSGVILLFIVISASSHEME